MSLRERRPQPKCYISISSSFGQLSWTTLQDCRRAPRYLGWIKRFILFHKKRHPKEMAEEEVSAFLTYLASERSVSASTQNQALCAIVFLYKHVISKELGELDLVWARRRRKLPVVLSPREIKAILAETQGVEGLVISLLYGTGLRLLEALRLKVKDVDFDQHQVLVRDGKGEKDRITMLPQSLVPLLRPHLEVVYNLHDLALKDGYAGVELPFALSRKYPNADREWAWQYVFPAPKPSRDPRSGAWRRHHLHERRIQRAFRRALIKTRIPKKASCHTMRHSFATHLLAAGYDIRTIQSLLGHKDVKTIMIYTHVLNKGGQGVKSPLDEI